MRRLAFLALVLGGCGPSTVDNSVLHECDDFIQDGTESDVDCGGSCGLCAGGRRCLTDADCASGSCSATGRCLDTVAQPVSVNQTLVITEGAAVDIAPGSLAGYGITASSASGVTTYRLVWTGDGTTANQYHEFYGTIYTAGTIGAINTGCKGTCNFNSNNYLSGAYSITGDQAVDFDSSGVNDLEGFDIAFPDAADGSSSQPVYFDLYIDGQHRPELVFFPSPGTSAGVNSPPAIPFGLYTDS